MPQWWVVLTQIEWLPTEQGGLTVNHKHITPLRWAELQPPAFGCSLPVIMMTLWPISVGIGFIYLAQDCGLVLVWAWHLSIHQPLKLSCDAVDTIFLIQHKAMLLFTPFSQRVQLNKCYTLLADVTMCVYNTDLEGHIEMICHCLSTVTVFTSTREKAGWVWRDWSVVKSVG